MGRLKWHEAKPDHETGVDRGVLYIGDAGVAWNGLVSVEEKEVGALDTDYYLDGVRRVIKERAGNFEATLQAYTYPREFGQYDGYTRRTPSRPFGMSYRTLKGEAGQKIHIVYNAKAKPSSWPFSTVSSEIDPSNFTWDMHATGISVAGAKPTSHVIIDMEQNPEIVETVENILYGTRTTDPRLPTPYELVELFESVTLLRVTQNGDGTWTASGPDTMIQINTDGSFHIDSPSAALTDTGRFTVHSL